MIDSVNGRMGRMRITSTTAEREAVAILAKDRDLHARRIGYDAYKFAPKIVQEAIDSAIRLSK